MKHCPNDECPDLVKYDIVAEFEDDVTVCSKCGTSLKLKLWVLPS